MQNQFNLLKKVHSGALAFGVLSQSAWTADIAWCKHQIKVSTSWNSTEIDRNSLSNVIKNMPNVTRIDIPNNVTIIGDRTFISCGSLTQIMLPAKF